MNMEKRSFILHGIEKYTCLTEIRHLAKREQNVFNQIRIPKKKCKLSVTNVLMYDRLLAATPPD